MAGGGKGSFSFGTSRFNVAKASSKALSVQIGQMRHRLALCRADDIVIDGATIVLKRAEVLKVWASISEKHGSLWSREGYAVKESRDAQSHDVCIRYRKDFEIASAAWLYEERRDNPARWWKVLKVGEKQEIGVSQWFWTLGCRLVEKSDFALAPVDDKTQKPNPLAAMPLPKGVSL